MGIKNWTVTVRQVKDKQNGLISYVNYLDSKSVQSHKNTEIYSVFENAASDKNFFLKNTLLEVAKCDKASSGRAFSSYATSFDFVLPETVNRPTPEQWKKITADILRTAHAELFRQVPEADLEYIDKESGKTKKRKDLSFKGDIPDANFFAKRTFCNIHDQNNPHLNLVIPSVMCGERLKRLDQKKLTLELKKQFNLSVLQHCAIDYKAYKPEKTGLGRRLPRSQYLAKKAEEQAVQAVELADSAKNDLKQQVVRGIHTIRATGTAQNEAMRVLIDKAVVRLGKETIDATEVEAKVMQSRISFQRLFQDIQKLTNNLVGWATAIITGESGYVIREKRDKVLENKDSLEKNPLYTDIIDSQIEQVIKTYESHLDEAEKRYDRISRHKPK